jgi:hypothetical protein
LLLTTMRKASTVTLSVLFETSSKQLSLITFVVHGPAKTCWFFVYACTQKRLHYVLQTVTYCEGTDKKITNPRRESREGSPHRTDVVQKATLFLPNTESDLNFMQDSDMEQVPT